MTDPLDPYASFTTQRFDLEVVPTLASLRREPKPVPEYSNLGYAVLTRALETSPISRGGSSRTRAC